MTVVESFLREPFLDQQNKLRKYGMLEIGKHLEIGIRKAMRKASLVRVIVEHMVDDDISEEEILNQLPADVREMTLAEMELVEAKIEVRTELETARIEQEIRFREIAISRQDTEVGRQEIQLRSDEFS